MLIPDPHLSDIQALEKAYATTCHELDTAKTIIGALQEEITALKEKLRLAQSKEFGKSSEQSVPASEETTTSGGEKTTVSGYTRQSKNRPRGKTTDLSHLPHFQIHHDLEDAKKCCAGCQAPLTLIGKDSTKKLEVLPQKLYVAEHLCYKYSCRACDTIIEAKKEKSAIPKGLGGDSLIAEVLENKYQHHLPLYRQSLMLANLNAPISDNTLSNWIMQVGDGLLPLYPALWKAIADSRYLQVDETPIKILKPDKQGYLWTYFAPLAGQGLVVFEASLTRSGEVAKQRLKAFEGILQTDGYNGYHALRSRKGIIPCGCLSHARRKFKEVITVSADVNGVAADMVERLKPLYQLEERMRKANYPVRARKKLRQIIAKPLLKSIHAWLSQLVPLVPTKSKLGQAIAYSLKQWPYLTQYLKHGWAQIDTNWVENQIRPIAIGKKNFLFMGHEQSANIHALFYSLVLSAILNKINPRLYLNYLLTQIHSLRQKKINPYLVLPHVIDKEILQNFANQQLQLAKSVLNHIA